MTDKKSYQILNKNKTMKLFFLGLFALIIVFLLYIFKYYLWVFTFSFIFYVALKPVFEKLNRKFKSRALCSTLMTLMLFFLVLTPSMLLLFSLYSQSTELYQKINRNQSEIRLSIEGFFSDSKNKPEWQENIAEALDYFEVDRDQIAEKIVAFMSTKLDQVSDDIKTIISLPVVLMIKFFLMILIIFFLFKDGNKTDGAIYKILPFPDDIERDIISKLKEVIYVLVFGNLIIMIIQGTMVGLGLSICGITNPLLWGTIASVLSLIPVIGTTLIWGPAAIFLALTGNYGCAAFVSIWSFSWYMILENLVKPKAFGDKLNFHPLIFFFLLLGSIQAFGLPGVIIGPIFLSLFYSFWEIYKVLDAYDLGSKIQEEEKIITPPQ